MTSVQSLLYAAASDITIERVRALVRQVGAESPMIEYKGQMCDTIARGVAALGNTWPEPIFLRSRRPGSCT